MASRPPNGRRLCGLPLVVPSEAPNVLMNALQFVGVYIAATIFFIPGSLLTIGAGQNSLQSLLLLTVRQVTSFLPYHWQLPLSSSVLALGWSWLSFWVATCFASGWSGRSAHRCGPVQLRCSHPDDNTRLPAHSPSSMPSTVLCGKKAGRSCCWFD